MPTRYFECKYDGSSKFWEITWDTPGLSMEYETRWGPIGGAGTRKVKSFTTQAERNIDLNKIIKSKLAKGYLEKKITQKEETKKEVKKPSHDYLEIW